MYSKSEEARPKDHPSHRTVGRSYAREHNHSKYFDPGIPIIKVSIGKVFLIPLWIWVLQLML